MLKNIKILLINFLIFILLISIIELAFGNKLFSKKLDCTYLLCSANYSYKNDLYEPYGLINYKKDRYGFRGLRKNINKIDILTIGGSTTDERYLETEDTWSEQLERKINNFYPNLNFDVVNAGIDGQSTYGHIWNFENWFPKLENFKTKYIFFYIGLNEYFSKERQLSDRGTKNLNYFQVIKHWLKENNGIIYKSYYLIYRKYYLKDVLNVGHKIRELKYKPIETSFLINDENIKELNYRLDKLIELTKKNNSIPIFITQRTQRHKIINNEIYSINDINYYSQEKQHSEIIMKNCKKNKIFCIDLFNKIDFTKNSLYDLVHTTPEGANLVANIIFDEFKFILNDN